MLKRLTERGVKMTIASSKRRPLVEEVSAHHDLQGYFSLLVGAQDVANHKPHPESVYKTLTVLGMEAQDTVVVGDSTYDLDMARNAGVDAIGVTTGVHAREILAHSGPIDICNSLDEVLPIILNGRHGRLPHTAA